MYCCTIFLFLSFLFLSIYLSGSRLHDKEKNVRLETPPVGNDSLLWRLFKSTTFHLCGSAGHCKLIPEMMRNHPNCQCGFPPPLIWIKFNGTICSGRWGRRLWFARRPPARPDCVYRVAGRSVGAERSPLSVLAWSWKPPAAARHVGNAHRSCRVLT